MKTADVPDFEVLAFVNQYGGIGCNCSPHPEKRSVMNAMPGIPRKLALSKMRSLIKRGLVSGCACGCRGDFELTLKGKDQFR